MCPLQHHRSLLPRKYQGEISGSNQCTAQLCELTTAYPAHRNVEKIVQHVSSCPSSIAHGLFNPNFPNQALITTPLVTTVDIFITYHLVFKKTSKQKKTVQGVHPEKINSCNSHRANSTVKTFLFSSGMRNCLTPSTHWAPQPGKDPAGLSICKPSWMSHQPQIRPHRGEKHYGDMKLSSALWTCEGFLTMHAALCRFYLPGLSMVGNALVWKETSANAKAKSAANAEWENLGNCCNFKKSYWYCEAVI